MNRLSKHKLVLLAILGIILLLGLLATYILQELAQPQAVTLEIIEWEIKRPNQTVTLEDALKSLYSNSEMSTMMCVEIGTYSNDDPAFASDFVIMEMTANLTVTTPNGFVESIYIILHKDNQSRIDWVNTLFDFENLSLHRVQQGFLRVNEAYLELMGLNQPSNVHARAPAIWWLPTPSKHSHQLETTFEFTYFNGTAHKKVIQPFQLRLIGKEEA